MSMFSLRGDKTWKFLLWKAQKEADGVVGEIVVACWHLFLITCVCIHGSVKFICSALQRRDHLLELHSENREPAGRAAQVGVGGMVGEEKEGRG